MCGFINRSHWFRVYLVVLLLGLLAACNLETAGTAPTPTPELPTAAFLFPENNSRVEEGTEINVEIYGKDLGNGIARIDFLVDEVSINSATPQTALKVPEFRVTMNWLAQGIGLHTFKAIVYRLDGTHNDTLIVVEVVPKAS